MQIYTRATVWLMTGLVSIAATACGDDIDLTFDAGVFGDAGDPAGRSGAAGRAGGAGRAAAGSGGNGARAGGDAAPAGSGGDGNRCGDAEDAGVAARGGGNGPAAGSGGAPGSQRAVGLVFEVQPAAGKVGAPLAAFSVRLVDAAGATVPEPRAITLELTHNPSGAKLGGTLSLQASGGRATFDDISLDRPGRGFTLKASSDGLAADTSEPFDVASGAAIGSGRLYGVTANNALVSFDAVTPDRIASSVVLAPLANGERVVGIDFRPADGRLYALTQNGAHGQLYVVDVATGALAQVGASFALSGASFGFDFNPSVDRIRVVSDSGVNLRLHPDTGALVATDTALAFAPGDINEAEMPNVIAAAYSNNLPGAVTTLFGVDSDLNVLVRQGGPDGTPSPNLGQLTTIGGLGSDVGEIAGFDVTGAGDGRAYAVFHPADDPNLSNLYAIDLRTGWAAALGTISIQDPLVGLAIDAPQLFAVSDGTTLISFNAQRPGTLLSAVRLSGLASDDTVVGIDFRPATGGLFGLGSSGTIYTIDPITGAASPLGAHPTALSGASFGFDFNPTVDRIRLVSEQGQNLRLNPLNGALVMAGSALNPGTPRVVAVAYTNNFAGATATTLYGLDSARDVLVAIDPPNGGVLTDVGPLAVDIGDGAGFDIASDGVAYVAAVAVPRALPALYQIDLKTGAAREVGEIAAPGVIGALAAPSGVLASAYGISGGNDLVRFNPFAAATLDWTRPIRGLAESERVVGIDVRPATGVLTAVTDEARLYTVDPQSGAATLVGGGPLGELTGQFFGVDFNPVPDRLRVVGDDGQNARVNPADGAVTVDTPLAFAPGDSYEGALPAVVAIAYTENAPGKQRTTVYGIDLAHSALVRLGGVYGMPSPNGGQLTTVGHLPDTDLTGDLGFDVSTGGTALLSNGTNLRVVNLATGATRPAGQALPVAIRALALAP